MIYCNVNEINNTVRAKPLELLWEPVRRGTVWRSDHLANRIPLRYRRSGTASNPPRRYPTQRLSLPEQIVRFVEIRLREVRYKK